MSKAQSDCWGTQGMRARRPTMGKVLTVTAVLLRLGIVPGAEWLVF